MIDIQLLKSTAPPRLHSCSVDVSSITNAVWDINRDNGPELSAKILRGNKMRSWQALFDEAAAALQFPYYFGENLNAFDECMADLEWLNARGYLIVILKADQVLADCDDAELQALITLLCNVASEWAKPVKSGGAWDREGKPFHVLFQSEGLKTAQFHDRLARCNVSVSSGAGCFALNMRRS
jgi:hypothetical protein